jgi:hypothetical protein
LIRKDKMSFDFRKNLGDKESLEKGSQMGESIAKGLGVGLSENSYRAITAMENVYVELETLTKNAAKNAEKLAKKRQERQLDNLKNSLKLELITEQEYYEKLKQFRDENLRQGTDIWYKCTEEIAAYNKRVMEEAEKQQRELAEKLLKIRDELAQKLKGNEPWSSTTKIRFVGMGQNGTDLVYSDTKLDDFREEIQTLEIYRDRIEELQSLGGVPDNVFADIADMDIEKGMAAVNAILMADEDTRKRFFSGYSRHEALAEDVSNDLFGILYANELKKDGIYSIEEFGEGYVKAGENEEFINVLKASFDEVPQSYFILGENAGTAFGEGFLGRIPGIMESARSYFAEEINKIAEQMSAAVRYAVVGASEVVNNSYSSTYNFNSSRDTTTQQLSAAKNAAALERLRGGVN